MPILTVAEYFPAWPGNPRFARMLQTDFRCMDTLFPILGIVLIVASLAQVGLWSGRMLRASRQQRARFAAEMKLLQSQIDEVAARRQARASPSAPAPGAPAIPAERVVASSDKGAARPGNAVDEACVGPWQEFRKFRVAKIRKETENTTSIYLQPVVAFPLPSYQPGQHLTIRFNIPGTAAPAVRCYTLSDAPGQPYYRISVKKTTAKPDGRGTGLVSGYINHGLAEGDILDVRPPAGRFFLSPGDTPIVLVAGGIGITPMMAILNQVAASAATRQCLLVYGVRNGRELAFGNDLARLQETRSNIHVVKCYSQPLATDRPNTDYQVHGRISVPLLQRMLPSPDFDFYMCGPSSFMESLYRDLRKWGVNDSRIRFESFGPSSIRRDTSKADAQLLPDPDRPATVSLDKSGRQLDWTSPTMTLLELLEAHGIAAESGCRAGNCGTCACRITEGSVRYETPPDECLPGHILPCVALQDGPIRIDL